MRLSELLSSERVELVHGDDVDKGAAIAQLSVLLSRGAKIDASHIEKILTDRENLQSTGIGEGVAIPHGALDDVTQQWAALLLVPEGVDFDAIDGGTVRILFAVIGPKKATGEHLKTLARVSKLLRSRDFRNRLVGAESGSAAFELIVQEEAKV